MRCAIIVLGCSTALPAQVPNSDGPFAGTGIALSLQDGGSLSGENLYLKDVGFRPPVPATWTTLAWATSPRPNFRMSAVLRAMRPACGMPAGTIDIDALSIGLDQVWADSSGHVKVPTSLPCGGVFTPPPLGSAFPWNALLLSVGASAGAAGSVIAQERDRADCYQRVEGDVFSYILQGGAAPTAWWGVTDRAADRSEMGLAAGDAIDALDVHVRLYALDDAAYMALNLCFPFVDTPTLYFSVSDATKGNVPTDWWDRPSGASTTPSGGTIFQSTWRKPVGTTPGSWTCPRVFLSPGDLGIGPSRDITALAVDQRRGCMLFSEAPYPARQDPIMFFGWGPLHATPVPVPYQYLLPDDTENPVSSEIGLTKNDAVTAVCADDPGIFQAIAQNGTTMMVAPHFGMGSPWHASLCLNTTYGISAAAFRDVDAGGNPRLRSFMIGWPHGVPESSFAVALLYVFNPATACYSVFSSPLIPFARNVCAPCDPGSPNCVAGDPIELNLPLPATTLLAPGALLIQWIGVTLSPLYINEANAVVFAFPGI